MGPRQDWTMDFITELLPSLQRGFEFDAILVVVNRFIKYSIYLSTQEDWVADTLADIFVEAVFIKYDMFVSFTSNRELFFTSHF